jgi:hypothetical protein
MGCGSIDLARRHGLGPEVIACVVLGVAMQQIARDGFTGNIHLSTGILLVSFHPRREAPT